MTRAIVPLTAAFLVLGVASIQAQRGGSSGARTGKMTIPVQKSGKVVMDDGSPLPEPVIVEAMCGSAAAVPISRTDSKGGFIVGRGREADVDARMPRGQNAPGNLAGCSLQARLPGYVSSQLRIVDNELFDLGKIVLARMPGIQGTMRSATSQKAPKDAQKAMEKALSALEKKKPDQARPQLEKAVEAYPEYAEAWFELGRVCQAAKELPQARNAYERSIKADSNYVKPYMPLAALLHQARDWKAVSEVSATLIKLDPFSYPGAYVLHAVGNLRLGNIEAAEASARQAVKLDEDHVFPEAQYTLGLLLAEKGKYAEAGEQLREFLRLTPNSPGAEQVKKMLAELDKAAAGQKQ